MSARRDEILRELGLGPVWRLRSSTGGAPASGSAGDPPARLPLIQGIHDRGYLPHLKAEGGIYFVTFRLADSLSATTLRQLSEIPNKQRSKEIEAYLDAGHGECLLARREIAEIVKLALLKFDGERYRLHSWVIMPNHMHALIEPLSGNSLSDVLHGIKSVSAHEANKVLGREGEFWQRESYDHLIRSNEDFTRCVDYIAQNPVKAGLVKDAGEYQLSSACRSQRNAGEAPALRGRGTSAGAAPAVRKPAEDDAGDAPALQKRTRTVAVAAPALPLDARAAGIVQMDWPQMNDSVAGCTACPLHKTRNKTVFGVGDERAEWLFVGEGPGADEDRIGEPFVGQAGKLLDNMLAAIKLKRGENVYIANVIKCRPPGNRNPESLEVAQCEPYLHRQIDLIKPKLIVALGKVAAVNLLKREASVASLRGKVLEYHSIPMIVTYHPAYLLRSLPEKAKAWVDLCFAVDTMKALQSRPAAPI